MKLARHGRGQGLGEYALILALIAIIAITSLIFLGGQMRQTLSDIGDGGPYPSSNASATAGIMVNLDASQSRLLVSGPVRPDGGAVLVRLVCGGAAGPWKSPDFSYDLGWITVIDPTSNQGCVLQAAEGGAA